MSGKSEPFSRKKVCTLHSNYIHIPNTLCLQVMLWICFLFCFFWSVKQLMSTYLSCTRPTEIKLAIIQPTKQKKNNKTWKIKGLHCHWTRFLLSFFSFVRVSFCSFVWYLWAEREKCQREQQQQQWKYLERFYHANSQIMFHLCVLHF